MPCDTPCGGCSHAGSEGPVDIEDMKDISHEGEVSQLKTQLALLETSIADLSTKFHAMKRPAKVFRSASWFDRTDDRGMSALYLERYLNYGFTKEEFLSGKPIIGIAQSGSDLTPCNRHHLVLAKRVRDGIIAAGGLPLEFPTHPIQESTRRPTATLDRNLGYMTLVELLHGYMFDAVVLLTGCDKTVPACLMAAATVNIPAICLNVGPMLNGWDEGKRVGSGSVVWKARQLHAAGEINDSQLMDMVVAGTPSPGHCNTMGTASTMNALAEALGMCLPGSAAIPAPYRERSQVAYETGLKIVDMAYEDIFPSKILTRAAFENAIVANTAIGGSTNAPIHLIAIAKHIGVRLDLDDWDKIGFKIPLLLNMAPAGEMLSEDYYRAGGLPAILAELIAAGELPHLDAMNVNGKTIGENCRGKITWDRRTIKPFSEPLVKNAGFLHLKGNLFDSAIMKMSVVSPAFRKEFLEDPEDPDAFECKVAVFDGPEDYQKRLDDADIDRRTILIMRGVGPIGYPGAAEVVNMHAPGKLLKQGVVDLPCIGDGRQSGTSGSPSILNASPEAANGGNLALVCDGDKVRVDLGKRRVDLLISEDELKERRKALDDRGGYRVPPSQTPWQEFYRQQVGPLSEGMVFESALKYQNIAKTCGVPRDNH